MRRFDTLHHLFNLNEDDKMPEVGVSSSEEIGDTSPDSSRNSQHTPPVSDSGVFGVVDEPDSHLLDLPNIDLTAVDSAVLALIVQSVNTPMQARDMIDHNVNARASIKRLIAAGVVDAMPGRYELTDLGTQLVQGVGIADGDTLLQQGVLAVSQYF